MLKNQEIILWRANIKKIILVGNISYSIIKFRLGLMKEVIPCANNSQLKQEIDNEVIREHLEVALSKKELLIRQKRKIIQKNHKYKYDRTKELVEYFNKLCNKEERNQVFNDGYKQSKIAIYLKISASAVAKILEKFL